MLPQLEMMALYNALNFSSYLSSPLNTSVAYSTVTSFMCPSENLKVRPQGSWAPANYAACYGGPGAIARAGGIIVPPPNPWYTSRGCGPFGTEGIPDGTSTTGMFSERMMGINGPGVGPLVYPGMTDAKRAIYNIASITAVPDQGANGSTAAQTFFSACGQLPSTTPSNYSNLAGSYWAFSMPYTSENTSYMHWNTPNKLSCSPLNGYEGDPNWAGSLAAITATSNHSGGVNVCFGDGSVKFIKDSINAQTWWALGSRYGGEPIAGDSY